MTSKRQQKNNNTYSRTVINPKNGIAGIDTIPKFTYVKHNPKGGIGAAMKKQPNFVKSRRKAPDGHEIIEIDYT